MTKTIPRLVFLLAAMQAVSMQAQSATYPPLAEYMMATEAEMALARSAAPANVSAHATVKILTDSGYKIASQGDNGFVCIVERGWGAPMFSPEPLRTLVYDAKLRAPICFDPVASRTVLPLQEMRARLGLEGKSPDEIARAVTTAYAKGQLPKMESTAFAYMFSADQELGTSGHWHPHMMVYTPYYVNAMLGGNQPGGPLPVVGDDAGTPFAVTVIPVDHTLAVRAQVR